MKTDALVHLNIFVKSSASGLSLLRFWLPFCRFQPSDTFEGVDYIKERV